MNIYTETTTIRRAKCSVCRVTGPIALTLSRAEEAALEGKWKVVGDHHTLCPECYQFYQRGELLWVGSYFLKRATSLSELDHLSTGQEKDKRMTRRAAIFYVSGELLRDALGMPEGMTIVKIVRHGWEPGIFLFYVEHPLMPEVPLGEESPIITPVITTDYIEEQLTEFGWDWGPGTER